MPACCRSCAGSRRPAPGPRSRSSPSPVSTRRLGWSPPRSSPRPRRHDRAATRALWHRLCYGPAMASRVVRARLDDAAERGLGLLMREGRNESEAVRTALVEAGRRRSSSAALAEEVRRLAADPADARERAAVMADLDAVAGDWPE